MARSNYCESCGAAIANEGYPCPECDHDPPNRKSPFIAAVLSFFIAGAGQLYAGRPGRGVAWFLGALVLGGVITFAAPGLLFVSFLYSPVSAVDAFIIASGTAGVADAEENVHRYECFDCSTEFNSTKTKEDASCPECGGIPRPE